MIIRFADINDYLWLKEHDKHINEDAQHFYRKMGYKEIGGFTYLEEPLEIIFHKRI